MAYRGPLIASSLAVAVLGCAFALAAPEARPLDPTAEAPHISGMTFRAPPALPVVFDALG